MNKLALVMIVRDEEHCIARCLTSASPYVDEIIVVDTGSTDRTKKIASECGASVYDFLWINDFSAARNFALSQSEANWNLVLDADEFISEFDVDSVNHFMLAHQVVGRIQVVSETQNQGESSETRNYISRLIPRGFRFEGRIHEQIVPNVLRCNVQIIVKHDGYLGTDKSNRNIPLLIEELKYHPNDPYYCYQLAKEYQGRSNLIESNSWYNRSYQLLTGKERYATNVVVDYIYLLMKTKQLDVALNIIKKQHVWMMGFQDYHFVCGLYFLDLVISDPQSYISYLPQIESSYRKCLEIGESDKYDSVVGTGSFIALYNLGNYFEVQGRKSEAMECYLQSSKMGYNKAEKHLMEMT